MLYAIIGFVTGAICWIILDAIFRKYVAKEKPVGKLIIDHQSVPEDEPYLFFQSYVDPRVFINKKTVIIEVCTEKLVSHE